MPVAAQRSETPRITVMTFQSPEKELGAKAADILRERLAEDFSSRTLQTISTADVIKVLDASGFDIADPLVPNDEYLLAKSIRVDMYVTGIIFHLAQGYRVEPKLILTREIRPSQPLPVQTSERLDDAMASVSRSVREAVKQLAGEKQCVANARSGKIREAITAANAATAAYPRAVLSRLCVEAVYYDLYRQAKTQTDSLAYSDSALIVASQVLQYDSVSLEPLKLSVELYRFRRDSVNYRRALMRLGSADSSNTVLLNQIVNELAASGDLVNAKIRVQKLLEQMPGDPRALRTALSVYSAAKDWAAIVATGEELAKADTSSADTSYFFRMGAAHSELKEPAKAAEVFAQGTAKFPNNADLWFFYSKALEETGQIQEAEIALEKAVRLNPTQYAVYLLRRVERLVQANQYDSVYTLLPQLVAKGVPSQNAATMAFTIGHKFFLAGNANKDRAEWERARKFLHLSNSISPTPNAQFFEGATAFSILQSAATEGAATKSCPLAQLAREAYGSAQANLTLVTGDSKFQSNAQGMLQYLPQFKASIDSQIKAYCK